MCSLEGRALSTVGAVSVSALTAGTPIGCGSPIFTGPVAPNMQAISCFAVLTTSGIVINTGTANLVGDIGSNSLTALGFNLVGVVGTIHPVPDLSTSDGSSDLTILN